MQIVKLGFPTNTDFCPVKKQLFSLKIIWNKGFLTFKTQNFVKIFPTNAEKCLCERECACVILVVEGF
jgi:hypothetical protein